MSSLKETKKMSCGSWAHRHVSEVVEYNPVDSVVRFSSYRSVVFAPG